MKIASKGQINAEQAQLFNFYKFLFLSCRHTHSSGNGHIFYCNEIQGWRLVSEKVNVTTFNAFHLICIFHDDKGIKWDFF